MSDELDEAERWLRHAAKGGYLTLADTARYAPLWLAEYDRRGECLRFLDEKYSIRMEHQQWMDATARELRFENEALRAARDRVLAYLDERPHIEYTVWRSEICRLLALPQDETESGE